MNVGVHCATAGCHQLDFLPFTCELCKLKFCLEHRDHECSKAHLAHKNVVVACPLCSQLVTVKDASVDDAISRHIDGGCHAPTVMTTSSAASSALPGHACGICNERELVRVVCASCGLQTCLRHRAPAAHACAAKAAAAAEHAERGQAQSVRDLRHRSAVSRIQSLLSSAASSSAAAASVRRIQQRQKAVGDKSVAADERVYLELLFPFDSGVAPKQMFFSKKASVGRVLDDAASAGKIANNNNKADAAKLYLISLKSGNPLPNGAKLQTLIESGQLASGDAILIEFLENTTAPPAAATPD